jgi:Cu2+-exporting ATPase
MIGDGINDAAVLAQADVGIAVAHASDMAKAEADMVILSSQLNALCKTYSLATRTKRIIIENLGWALCYNAVAIPFAAAGHVPPWLAALGMSFSSIVVVLNSLRINKIT